MAMMRACLIPSLLLALAILGPSPAYSAPKGASSSTRQDTPPVTHVLGFVTENDFDQAEALTRAMKQALSTSRNGRLGEGDFSLEVLTAALGCSDVPDPVCLTKIADKTKSRRLIWGLLNVQGETTTVELNLFDGSGTARKTEFSYRTTTDSADDAPLTAAAQALSELLGPLKYGVRLESPEESATVVVDGAVAGKLSSGRLSLELTAGKHEFELRDEEHSLETRTVQVRVSETTLVRFDRTPTDSPAKVARANLAVSEPPATTAAPGNAQRTWGYITLGTGGVLLAVGGLAAGRLYQLNEDDGYKAYREGLRSSEDACSQAKAGRVIAGAMSPSDVTATCNEADTLEVVELVTFIGGAVAAGTGLTLLLTSKSEKPSATEHVTPTVRFGKNRADFELSLQF